MNLGVNQTGGRKPPPVTLPTLAIYGYGRVTYHPETQTLCLNGKVISRRTSR